MQDGRPDPVPPLRVRGSEGQRVRGSEGQRVRSRTLQKSSPTVSRVVKEYEDENEKKIRNGKWETPCFLTPCFWEMGDPMFLHVSAHYS